MLVIILSTNLQGAKEEKQYVCEISAGNPYEIDISEDEEDNEEVVEEAGAKKVSNVEEMDVPDAVFGGLKKSGDE